MDRRGFLAVMGTSSIAIAGCSDLGEGDSEEDSGTNQPAGTQSDGTNTNPNSDSTGDSTRTETVVDTTRNIQEDEWYRVTFTANSSALYEARMTVRDGPSVDFYVTSQEELTAFENGDRFRYNRDLSMPDSIGGTASAELPAGDLAFIVDNSNQGEAAPPTNAVNDVATVEITVTSTF